MSNSKTSVKSTSARIFYALLERAAKIAIRSSIAPDEWQLMTLAVFMAVQNDIS